MNSTEQGKNIQESNVNSQLIADHLCSDALKRQLIRALPNHMDADRFARVALTELRKNKDLGKCEPVSFLGSLMRAGELGLEVGSDLGQAYLIPRKKENILECNLMIGYRGMLELIWRSGKIKSIQSQVVYENDIFDFCYGINPTLHHIPSRGKKGAIIGAYCCAILKDGASQFEVLMKDDIDKIMSSSPGYSMSSSPWRKYYEDMARKTVIRKLFKFLPISIEMSEAISIDEAADGGYQKNNFSTDWNEIDNQPTKSDKLSEYLSSQEQTNE